MLGDFAVGKTSLVRRFVEGRFDDKYLSSIGVKISRKTLDRGDHRLDLIIWDLSGGENFIKMQPAYLQGAAGALIVGDLTRRDTLQSFSDYYQQFLTVNPAAPVIFLANKVDLLVEPETSGEEIKACIGELNLPILLTSAKTGERVEIAMLLLADLIEAARDKLDDG